ncbi:MAG: FAD-dependent monooxygenase [Hyphomicrobiales bacterium]
MGRTPALPGHIPLLSIGAGPTGLLSANLLGTYGVETLVVEQNEATSDLPKAILLDDEGFRALQAAGLADEVAAHVISGYGARYYAADGSCFARVEAPVTAHGYPRRNSFLQPEFERVLLGGLDRFAHVRAAFTTKALSVADRGGDVTVRLEHADGTRHDLSCAFVLACDGARSGVREQLGIPMPGMTDARDWVVIDTVNDPDRDRYSKFFCDPARPMVSIPAPGGGRRYEFMILPGEDPEEMQRRETIRPVLARFRTVPDEDILRAVVYTFHARVADRISIGRIALLGDAAHLSPPFAGQGMNAGLRDAFNVAWKVRLALDGVAPPRILDTYETERKGPITEMINYAVALGEIVMPVGGLDEAAKQEIRANLMGEQPVSGQAVPMRAKPEAAYAAGWRAPVDDPSGQGLTGQPVPQFPVETPNGAACLLDDILGPGFALVAIGREAEDALARLTDPDDTGLRLKRVAVRFDGLTAEAETVNAVLAAGDDHGLKAHAGAILLVRPDRFVAAHWDTGSAPDIRRLIGDLCA